MPKRKFFNSVKRNKLREERGIKFFLYGKNALLVDPQEWMDEAEKLSKSQREARKKRADDHNSRVALYHAMC